MDASRKHKTIYIYDFEGQQQIARENKHEWATRIGFVYA